MATAVRYKKAEYALDRRVRATWRVRANENHVAGESHVTGESHEWRVICAQRRVVRARARGQTSYIFLCIVACWSVQGRRMVGMLVRDACFEMLLTPYTCLFFRRARRWLLRPSSCLVARGTLRSSEVTSVLRVLLVAYWLLLGWYR